MSSGPRAIAGAAPAETHLGRPSRWLVLAAAVAIGWGAFSIAFALLTHGIEALGGPAAWLLLLWPCAAIASGVGLLRARSWARYVAGGLAVFALAMDVPGLLAGATTALDPLRLVEIAGSLLMLYALVRRWPASRDGR